MTSDVISMTSEEARQQAQVEGLTLRVSGNTTGYFGVHLAKPGQRKPYQAASKRGGKKVHLGYFATAEEAALCIARSPEGQALVKRAAPLKKRAKGKPCPALPSNAILDTEMGEVLRRHGLRRHGPDQPAAPAARERRHPCRARRRQRRHQPRMPHHGVEHGAAGARAQACGDLRGKARREVCTRAIQIKVRTRSQESRERGVSVLN